MFLELFLFAKNMKFFTKTISYGAGNSKLLKTEIEWILDFGRTSASQQKIILWDSGNIKLTKVVMEAYSIRNDWLKKWREVDTTSGNSLRGMR